MSHDTFMPDDTPRCMQCEEKISQFDWLTPKNEQSIPDDDFCSDECRDKYEDDTLVKKTEWWTNFDFNLFEEIIERKKTVR